METPNNNTEIWSPFAQANSRTPKVVPRKGPLFLRGPRLNDALCTPFTSYGSEGRLGHLLLWVYLEAEAVAEEHHTAPRHLPTCTTLFLNVSALRRLPLRFTQAAFLSATRLAFNFVQGWLAGCRNVLSVPGGKMYVC